jgi:hypothetical protein
MFFPISSMFCSNSVIFSSIPSFLLWSKKGVPHIPHKMNFSL